MNDGTGHFTVLDPNVFTNGEPFFAENAIPLDLNGDGLIDFVTTDFLPGSDNIFGTDDDETQIITLLAQ